MNNSRLLVWLEVNVKETIRTMNISRFLIWIGVLVVVVEFCASLYGIMQASRLTSPQVAGLNLGSEIYTLIASFFQGGVLIGLGKIIEILQQKR